jgi:RNA polymerase sigma-70 factor (ECF subfamily)
MQATAQVVDFRDAAQREAVAERATVVAAIAGDRQAFEKLYRRHAARLHGLCLRLTGHRETAEDCVQEAFVSAWRALPGFETRSAFATWLHRIAVNTVLARRRGLAAALEHTVDGEIGDLDRRHADTTPALDVEAAIAALPDGARHVLVLVGLYGFSHEEAADALDIAVGTSKAQLHRARALLAAQLGLDPEAT